MLLLIPRIDHNLLPVQIFTNGDTIGPVADLGAALSIIGAGHAVGVLGKKHKAVAGFIADLPKHIGGEMAIVIVCAECYVPYRTTGQQAISFLEKM